MHAQKSNILTVFLIIAIGAFYIATIREGHPWGGDFSMYIHHAKNICEGIDYRATGYLYNPFSPSLSPKAYPPVFPLLLAPVYCVFGLDLTVMKIEIIVIFLLFLLLFYRIVKDNLPLDYSLAILLTVGLNPFFCHFKDNIVSDIPFLLFAYLTLMLIHRIYHSSDLENHPIMYGLLTGLLMYLSIGTRSIGLVLIPCLFIYHFMGSKKPPRFLISAILFCILLILSQKFSSYGSSNYSDQFLLSLQTVLNNLDIYTESFFALWHSGYSKNLALALFILLFASIGYLMRFKEEPTVFEVFTVLYMVPIIFWPSSQRTRFLIPIIPLLIFYSFYGIYKNPFFQKETIKKAVFSLLVLAIFLSYLGRYSKTDFTPFKEGIGKKSSIALFTFIKNHTHRDDVFIFLKPRVLSLFTGRSASIYHWPKDKKDLLLYFQKIGVSYVVVRPGYERLGLLIRAHQRHFELVYRNSDFRVYRFKHNPL